MSMPSRSLLPANLDGATATDVLELAEAHQVRFLCLQFTDILGSIKTVEVPAAQFRKALKGDIVFDGSSVAGTERVEESDMLLVPDPATFQIFPWGDPASRVGRVICDVMTPDGVSYAGDPRAVLKRQLAIAAGQGFTMLAGMEAEFFLFASTQDGRPTAETNDVGGYFDQVSSARAEEARRAIMDALEQMGFEVEAAHHEVANGQHEIDFRHAESLRTADNVATFRFVVKQVARSFGLVASFMPKPVLGQNGSGMHTHQSLMQNGQNAFWDPSREWELSLVALRYIGGLLKHARAMCAVTNPLVNSYKRLVPGFEAPVNVAWSMRNRSPMIRVPDRRGDGTRLELRTPDPSANPYLALTVMLAAGLDGIRTEADWREPVNQNIGEMSYRERRRLRVDDLPDTLHEACDELARDEVLREALGEEVFQQYLAAKRSEWSEYNQQVTAWERNRYLSRY